MINKDIKKAVEISAIVWREIVRLDLDEKKELVDSIYDLVKDEENECSLCTLFFKSNNCSPLCPLQKYNQCGEDSPFGNWVEAIEGDEIQREDAVTYAQQIVDILEKWLEKDNKPKYSIEQLDKYTYRFVVCFDDEECDCRRSVDIYTNNTDKGEASSYIKNKISQKYNNVKVEHCSSREQDKAYEALIDEWLKEI